VFFRAIQNADSVNWGGWHDTELARMHGKLYLRAVLCLFGTTRTQMHGKLCSRLERLFPCIRAFPGCALIAVFQYVQWFNRIAGITRIFEPLSH
jgi:hypothetical protein